MKLSESARFRGEMTRSMGLSLSNRRGISRRHRYCRTTGAANICFL